jgi:hypothetical protein
MRLRIGESRAAFRASIATAVLALSLLITSDALAQGACPEGDDWNAAWGACVPKGSPMCAANEIGLLGACLPCSGLAVPNITHTACLTCPAGQHPSSDGGECVGNGGTCGPQTGWSLKCAPWESCESLPVSGGMPPQSACAEDCKPGLTMADDRTCKPMCGGHHQFFDLAAFDPGHPYAACRDCPAGSVASSDHLSCISCPSGEIPAPGGADYCVKPGSCPWPQLYSDDPGHPCATCPPGEVASPDQAACQTDCRGKGAYDPWTGTCVPCTGPTVSDEHGWACIPCAQGVAAPDHAQCIACAPGKAPNRDHTSCIACTGKRVIGDGWACMTCKLGTRPNGRHSACIGPTTHVIIPPPAISKPNPILNPGILENNPNPGIQSPAPAGRPSRAGARSGAGIR